MLATVIGLTFGAIQGLQDSSREEVANEFDCISERPPPPSCQKRPVATTTTTTISATTSTTQPASTTTTTTTPNPSGAAWVVPPRGTWSCPFFLCWSTTAELTLGGVSQPMTVQIGVFSPSNQLLTTIPCTTTPAGACTVQVSNISFLTSSVAFRVTSITSPPGLQAPTQTSSPVPRP